MAEPLYPLRRFALVSDIHYCETDDRLGRHYRQAPSMLAAVVRRAREFGACAIIELGDLKDLDECGPPDRARSAAEVARVEAILQGAGLPALHVVGNHDVDCFTKDEFLALIRQPAGAPPGAGAFALELCGWRWLVLDANFRPDGTPLRDGHLNWTDPTIPGWQMEWLERELAGGRGLALIAVHQVLDLDPPDPFAVRNSAQVRRLIATSGRPVLVVQGHRHEPNVRRIGRALYYTVAGLVDSAPEEPSWALLEVGAHLCRIRGFGAALDAELVVDDTSEAGTEGEPPGPVRPPAPR
ncbi:MAG: metallophosphoesterase family protein [Kiritimatiellae bacterium]|nr:metallophosphoesterase family protein [Kiritimatiellia bacterium]